MNTITFLTGDATQPQTENTAIIAHVCNDIGLWGAGFVVALTNRWPDPEASYRQWYSDSIEDISEVPFELGRVQLVQVEDDIWVANMIGQRGVRGETNKRPVDYNAIEKGLQRVAGLAVDMDAEVHMPRIGCGLAGGTWGMIEPLVRGSLLSAGVPVFVYDLPES